MGDGVVWCEVVGGSGLPPAAAACVAVWCAVSLLVTAAIAAANGFVAIVVWRATWRCCDRAAGRGAACTSALRFFFQIALAVPRRCSRLCTVLPLADCVASVFPRPRFAMARESLVYGAKLAEEAER